MKFFRYFILGLAIASGTVPRVADAHNPAGGHTTTTTVSCTPDPVVINTATTCTATVTDVIGNGQDAVPSGTVTFSSSGAGSFNSTTCAIAPAGGFTASCSVTYTPTASGTHTITADYPLTLAPSHRFGASAGTDSVTVQLARPTVTKAFSPTSIGSGATSTITITLSNSNASAITGVAFTDTYPASLVNASTPAGSTTCTGGSVTAAAGGGSVALSGATIPASGSCTVTVSVTSSVAGSYTNTLGAGTVTSTNAGSNIAAASATLTVLARPSVTKAFSPTSIATSTNSTITITLSNSNASAITGAAFTDTYPASLVNAATPAGSTTCTGGSVTAAAGGGSVALSGATIPASGSCTVTVSVTSSVAGSYTNTLAIGAVTSTNAGSSSAAASATLTVLARPSVTKAFSPTSIATSTNSTITITLSNSNASAITGAAFTDTYPASLVNAATPAGSTTCTGGSVTAAAGGGSVALSGATIPASGSCTVTVSVTSSVAGSYTNTLAIGAVTSTNAGSNSAATSATLTVLARPTVTKAFSPTSIGTSTASTLTITLSNSNASAITGVAFTDTYPASLVNAATPAGSTTCTGGTVTAAASGASVALSGATIPASGSCTVTVSVTSSAAGSYTNTLGVGAVTSTNAGSNTAAASATLTVLARLTVAKTFSPNVIATGATSTLTITLSNSNASAITGVAFTDTYPANVVNAPAPGGSTTCAGGTVTASAGGTSVALSSGNIPGAGSCTVTVSVTSSTPGSYTNSLAIGAVTSGNAGSNLAAASATLTVNASVTAFDAVEVGAAPRTNLFTKLSGVNFTVDIVALDAANAVSTGYTGTVSLTLVDASSGGGVCASMTSLQGLGSLTFIVANAGRKTTAAINYAGAVRNAKIRMTDAGLGITSCSFDAFAIRPTSLAITSNMTNSGSSGTPMLNAGGNFTLTATALAGYNGTPTVDSTKVVAHAGANQIGSIAGVFAAAAPGTGAATGSTFTYSEVGNFQFAAQGVFDDAFTAVDQPNDCTNDFSNALAGGKYGCKFGTTAATSLFGRFTPADFAVTRNSPSFTPACSASFTYVGQPFNYATAPAITVTARNSAGVTTRNYVGAYMKITNADIAPNSTALRYSRFDVLGSGSTPALDVSALPTAATDPAIGAFVNGVGTLTFSGGATGAVLTRSQQVLPFNADIALAVSVADSDGVVVARIDGLAAVNPVTFGAATAGNGITFGGGATPKQMRFGRLALGNAFGSERLDLPIPIETQYYNSNSVYVTNANDNCTAIAVNNVWTSSGTVTGGGTFASGKGNLKVTKPLSKVSIDLCIDLDGSSATDPSCVAAVPANRNYLQWKWTAASFDKDPRSKATFGIFKNADEFIYLRENF